MKDQTNQKTKEAATVLIVDDSLIFRKALENALSELSYVQVIGSAFNGIKALEFLQSGKLPDIITLDVEMPEMDGMETLKKIMEFNHDHPEHNNIEVIMVSSLTRAGAELTIRALQMGAFDFITKQANIDGHEGAHELKLNLKDKIYSLLHRHSETETLSATRAVQKKGVSRYEIILIGVSTGGPRALATLIPELTTRTNLPIVIVQHMPPEFTGILAQNLDRATAHATVHEAVDGDLLESDTVYIAKGDQHLIFREGVDGIQLAYSNSPPENGSKPSVDVMFRSASGVYQERAIALILTGMGSDGLRGLRTLRRNGAHIIAQDESSSIVWGMPGSAVRSELVDDILDLNAIPRKVQQLVNPNDSL